MKNHKNIFSVVSTILISCCLLFINCLWVTNFETARTTAPGKLQMGGSLSPFLYFSSDGTNEIAILPFPELNAKLGVTERLDIGARWGFGPGIGLNTKYQFLKNNVDGALFLEGSYYGVGSVGGDDAFSVYNVRPALIISREGEGQFPFSLSLGLHYWNTGISGARVGITSLVGNIGLPIRVGSNRSIRIMPEMGILLPISGSVSDNNDDVFEFTGQSILQIGIGISSVKSND